MAKKEKKIQVFYRKGRVNLFMRIVKLLSCKPSKQGVIISILLKQTINSQLGHNELCAEFTTDNNNTEHSLVIQEDLSLRNLGLLIPKLLVLSYIMIKTLS